MKKSIYQDPSLWIIYISQDVVTASDPFAENDMPDPFKGSSFSGGEGK